MAASSFRVSWSRFPSHVLSALDSLRQDEDFVDVSIYCGRRLIKAHRNVLSASSTYFKEIFKANPSSHPVVILCDVDHASLRSLVDFMYHGEIEVPTARLDELLRLGEMLQVQGISSCKGVGSEEPGNPQPPTQPPADPLPPGDVISPDCAIGDPGRRRRRSRRHTPTAGEEEAAAADAGPGPLPAGPGPLPAGGLLTPARGPGLGLPTAPAAALCPPPPPPPAAHCASAAVGVGPVPPAELPPAGVEPGAPPADGRPLRVKTEWPEEPPDAAVAAADVKLLLDESEQSGLDMSQYSGGIFAGGMGSRRPLTGAERARRYRERKKLKKLYEALLGGSPRREQLTVQL